MKAIEVREEFGLERLALVERPDPRPGPGELLLGMRAASVNYRDLLMVSGHYDPRQPLPLIPGSDGVGEVLELGEGATLFRRGDRVAPIFAQRWLGGEPTRAKLRSTLGGPLDGTFCQRMVVPEESAVAVPEHLSDEEGATLVCAGLTAWSAVATHGEVGAGHTVLVLGTGGVSIFALQFAVALGARVIVTSSDDRKLARAAGLGAWRGINYRETPEWGRAVRALTDGNGVDLVVEVGGAGTLDQSLGAVRFGGRVAMIGVLGGGAAKVNMIPVLMQQIRIQGILVGDREGFETMNDAIARHRLRPVVDRVFPLEQAPAALEHLRSGRHFGKICLSIDGCEHP